MKIYVVGLSNSPYTTNRILEIPQDIKLELNNGTLTLKTGSKVYVPNGFEADGVTPKFDTIIIESDVSMYFAGVGRGQCLACYQPDVSSIGWYPLSECKSGTSLPSGTSIFYNISTNNVTFIGENTKGSLPLGIIYESNGSGITSIDQIFNGFGYIGSTVFALPMKGESTTAINQNGTVTKTIWESTTVQTANVSASGEYSMSSAGILTAGFNEVGYTKLADVTYYDSRIQNVNFYDIGFVANTNASNFSQAGRSYLSGLASPSSKFETWTLGASGASYTAPANGHVVIRKISGVANAYLLLRTNRQLCNGGAVGTGTATQIAASVKVSKGDTVYVDYSATGNTVLFGFVYDNGEV